MKRLQSLVWTAVGFVVFPVLLTAVSIWVAKVEFEAWSRE